MPTQEKFKGFTYQENEKYKEAAVAQYGKEVMEQAIQRHKGKEEEIAERFNQIFFAFSENKSAGLDAEAKENTVLAQALHEHLCKYSFDCSEEVFSAIGRGYVQNPEFKNNLDKFGEGIAQYVCDAIQRYVSEKKK